MKLRRCPRRPCSLAADTRGEGFPDVPRLSQGFARRAGRVHSLATRGCGPAGSQS
jgi:hypothetical protein